MGMHVSSSCFHSGPGVPLKCTRDGPVATICYPDAGKPKNGFRVRLSYTGLEWR